MNQQYKRFLVVWAKITSIAYTFRCRIILKAMWSGGFSPMNNLRLDQLYMNKKESNLNGALFKYFFLIITV